MITMLLTLCLGEKCLCKPDMIRIGQVFCTVWCSKECLYVHIKFHEHRRPFRACTLGRDPGVRGGLRGARAPPLLLHVIWK